MRSRFPTSYELTSMTPLLPWRLAHLWDEVKDSFIFDTGLDAVGAQQTVIEWMTGLSTKLLTFVK